jgi:hypothetical protein
MESDRSVWRVNLPVGREVQGEERPGLEAHQPQAGQVADVGVGGEDEECGAQEKQEVGFSLAGSVDASKDALETGAGQHPWADAVIVRLGDGERASLECVRYWSHAARVMVFAALALHEMGGCGRPADCDLAVDVEKEAFLPN